jgi:aryl-alcohol dehydrogenase-like predicted oxidoreductase
MQTVTDTAQAYGSGASETIAGRALRDDLAQVRDFQRFAAEEIGTSVAQRAVAWMLANPAVQVAIVGARRARHIDEAFTASELHLGDSELTHIDRIVAGTTTFTGPSSDAMPTR